jgi:hypothetical protein
MIRLSPANFKNRKYKANIFANTETELDEINSQLNNGWKAILIDIDEMFEFACPNAPSNIVLKTGEVVRVHWSETLCEAECIDQSFNGCDGCNIKDERTTLVTEEFSSHGYKAFEIYDIPQGTKLITIEMVKHINNIKGVTPKLSETNKNNLTEDELNFLLT